MNRETTSERELIAKLIPLYEENFIIYRDRLGNVVFEWKGWRLN